jgi:hypothetical protein
MNSDMKVTTHGHFSGTNNSMPIREAKEEQEMSHQRLHLGKSSSTGYQQEVEQYKQIAHRNHCYKI